MNDGTKKRAPPNPLQQPPKRNAFPKRSDRRRPYSSGHQCGHKKSLHGGKLRPLGMVVAAQRYAKCFDNARGERKKSAGRRFCPAPININNHALYGNEKESCFFRSVTSNSFNVFVSAFFLSLSSNSRVYSGLSSSF